MTVFPDLSVLIPDAAGRLYPAEADALRSDIRQLRRMANRAPRRFSGTARAVLLPNDAYVSSGPVLAAGIRALEECAPSLRRMVILSASCRGGFGGFAAPQAPALETPLGVIAVDEPALQLLQGAAPIELSDRRHECETGIEVLLPMVQELLPGVPVVPLLTGAATPREIASLLDAAFALEDTVILISSNLSQGLPLRLTQVRSADTAARIEANDPRIERDAAAGSTLVNGMIAVAALRGWTATRLALATSADAAGQPHRVTGYGAWAWG